MEESKDDNIRGVTLRVAIFFGLTTFTLCIAIFYIKAMLDDTNHVVDSKDSVIQVLRTDMETQLNQIKSNENEIRLLKDELSDMRTSSDDNSAK